MGRLRHGLTTFSPINSCFVAPVGPLLISARVKKSLDETNAFTSRRSDEISITVLGGRALATWISHTTNLDGTYHFYRNIRLFSKQGQDWKLELWYNYDLTSL